MTVLELIELLKTFPQDAKVRLDNEVETDLTVNHIYSEPYRGIVWIEAKEEYR